MTVATDQLTATEFYAGGRWHTSTATSSLTVTNPFDLSPVGTAPDGTAADIDVAVRAARAAFSPWSALTGAQRAEWMEKLADEIDRRSAELSALVTAENGQPVSISRPLSSFVPASHLRYYAGIARDFEVESERANLTRPGTSVLRREPVGVAGLIVPWNYPISLITSKLAPALAVGCTVVIKPAAETPLSALKIAEAADAIGMPPGVINVVTGGRETGAALVDHPGVDKIAFTGSTAAGKAIAARCGERLIPVTLELGGKSAAVVLDDADLNDTIDQLRRLSFMNSGQTCFLLSRVLVPRTRYDEFADALTALADSLVLGDPKADSTELGPLVSNRIRDRVTGLVDAGTAAGATVLTGGRKPDTTGYFYSPTIVADVDRGNVLWNDEVFGPVVVVAAHDSDDQAVRMANDTVYGLGGAVFSADEDRALTIARQMETGTLGINSYMPDTAQPFGGYKESGIGRENGPEAIDNYLKVKAIYR